MWTSNMYECRATQGTKHFTYKLPYKSSLWGSILSWSWHTRIFLLILSWHNSVGWDKGLNYLIQAYLSIETFWVLLPLRTFLAPVFFLIISRDASNNFYSLLWSSTPWWWGNYKSTRAPAIYKTRISSLLWCTPLFILSILFPWPMEPRNQI